MLMMLFMVIKRKNPNVANRLNHNYTILPCGVSYIKANEWRGEMKTLTAKKVKDGYFVEITHTHHIYCESDVYKLVKQEGLKIKPQFSDEKRIYAD